MARPLRRDAQRNRELLVAAARRVFAERGLNAPLDEVARRAGVSIGTLYNRFPTRIDLIDAVFVERVAMTVRIADEALTMADPWEAFVWLMTRMAELQAADRGYTDVCTYTLPLDTATERAKADGRDRMCRIISRAQEGGALRPDVTIEDISLLRWGVARAAEAVRTAAPNAWRRQLALALDGLRADAAHPLPEAALPPETVKQAMTLGYRG